MVKDMKSCADRDDRVNNKGQQEEKSQKFGHFYVNTGKISKVGRDYVSEDREARMQSIITSKSAKRTADQKQV